MLQGLPSLKHKCTGRGASKDRQHDVGRNVQASRAGRETRRANKKNASLAHKNKKTREQNWENKRTDTQRLHLAAATK